MYSIYLLNKQISVGHAVQVLAAPAVNPSSCYVLEASEGRGSRAIFNLHLLLPHDLWAATVDPAGIARGGLIWTRSGNCCHQLPALLIREVFAVGGSQLFGNLGMIGRDY